MVLTDNVTLRDNWTLEFMAHAGNIHQLELNIEDYFLRNTGNRGIKALHSIILFQVAWELICL